jgi:RNA polymerase sigma factor (TIGR02999 family)
MPLVQDVTRILDALQQGDPKAAEELLPLVYRELRALAAHKMAGEAPGHTLQPTALVHEAWLRVVGPSPQVWQNRAHFFGAAAEAMRRILVEHARRKQSLKRGGGSLQVELDEAAIVLQAPPDELLAVHEALDELAAEDAAAAELVKLRYFVGMSMEEAATALGMGKRTAESLWTYARVWLHRAIRGQPGQPGQPPRSGRVKPGHSKAASLPGLT